ncbi:MAG: 2-oxoacid:acceptor oxidoreductase family protein [Burkholderiales bacterium]|nr:2-oxoacid:acceptor oxidoreductase family protein [Burkholderiales bacterium]
MYRIRFHGRGGQGIKTAAQALGTAFFLEGFEVQDAPRYGAERRGAPIFAYVRAARAPIQERGVIARPDAVLVADETLVPVPAAGVLQGLAERTVLVVASSETGETWRERLALPGPVLALAPDEAGGPLAGMACAGAAARLVGVIGRERLEAAVREEIGKLGAAVLERNLAAALAAYDALAPHAGLVAEGAPVAAAGYRPPEWIELPRDTAHFAAPDIDAPATSVAAKTGAWRTLRPVIDYARCNRCSWVCGTLCPDSAIAVDADRTPRIDYDHCKGCMVCLAVCPPHAIAAEPERARAEAAE